MHKRSHDIFTPACDKRYTRSRDTFTPMFTCYLGGYSCERNTLKHAFSPLLCPAEGGEVYPRMCSLTTDTCSNDPTHITIRCSRSAAQSTGHNVVLALNVNTEPPISSLRWKNSSKVLFKHHGILKIGNITLCISTLNGKPGGRQNNTKVQMSEGDVDSLLCLSCHEVKFYLTVNM